MKKMKLNPDKDLVNLVNEKLKENNGYCPCAVIEDIPEERRKDYKCPCKEFRENVHSGECHCGKFVKD